MQWDYSSLRTGVACLVIVFLVFGGTSKPALAEETEILKVTVGEPTVMAPKPGNARGSVAISRTGTVAAFYQSGGSYAYRVSPDGGKTWSEQMSWPTHVAEGYMFTALRGGGVLKMMGQAKPPTQGKQNGEEVKRVLFSGDFLHYEVSPASVDLSSFPHEMSTQTPKASFYPVFDKKMLELDNGDLLATMYGVLEGDTQYRTMIVRSSDQGCSWRYQSTVAYDADDPNPEFAGDWDGYCEPSLTLLPDGQLMCIMRTEGGTPPYKPLYTAWSSDLGKTWTKPRLTQPPLKNISPTLAVLDNGVVACIYGRPGIHVVFSTDQGHTWTNRVTFTNLGTLWLAKDRSEGRSSICGMGDMIKVGPNKLLAIGAVGYPGGTQVFPITVEKVKVSPARVALTGRVINQEGKPIAGAKVEQSPNRYAVDSWKENTELDPWRGGPKIVGLPSPWLDYRLIRKGSGYPTVQTDAQGHFRFESVKLGEHILTVEAAGYAPQSQRVKLAPEPESQWAEFSLKPGKAVRGRVLDSRGKAVVGASVILNKWHVYSDSKGFFSWSVEAPVPNEVELKVHKLYSREYKKLEKTILLSQIDKRPVILQRDN